MAEINLNINNVVDDDIVESVKIELIATPPGIPAFKLVRLSSSNYCNTASSDDDAKMPVLGIAENAIGGDFTGWITLRGKITNALWSWTPNMFLWASTSGDMTQSVPSSGVSQKVGIAITNNTIYFEPACFTVRRS